MKKWIAVLLAAIIFASMFTAVYAAEEGSEFCADDAYAELYGTEEYAELYGAKDDAVLGDEGPILTTGAEYIANEYPGSLGKYLGYSLLSTVTLGWYAISKENKCATDINRIVPGANLTTGAKFYILTYVTCGIYHIIWSVKTKNCLNEELARRGIDYKISLWFLWADYKIFKAANLLIADYNAKGY